MGVRRPGPRWLGGEAVDVEHTVAFRDKLVTVGVGGVLSVRDRDIRWVDTGIVECGWEEAAEATRWQRALGEWGQGEEGWEDLLGRVMGAMMMPSRKWAKGLLMVGKVRGGKGTISQVMGWLVGGGRAVMSRSMDELAGQFGLDGIGAARALMVNEISKQNAVDRAYASRVIKQIWGQDAVMENGK